ncbi:hypothetical protein IJI89_00275 [Candidatus Saccharibacteria bacterium]|nr:hypothetical protein [Candidatus Saccharibacteria bacterium]
MGVLTKRKIEFREDFAVALIITGVFLLVAVMVGIGMNLQAINKLDNSYFKSDAMKLVLSMDRDIASFEDGEYEPDITHVVYYYTGNTINNVRIFFAYDTKVEAKTAYNNISMEDKNWALKKKLHGKYVVFELDSSQYNQLTTEMVKEGIASMTAAGGTVELSEN